MKAHTRLRLINSLLTRLHHKPITLVHKKTSHATKAKTIGHRKKPVSHTKAVHHSPTKKATTARKGAAHHPVAKKQPRHHKHHTPSQENSLAHRKMLLNAQAHLQAKREKELARKDAILKKKERQNAEALARSEQEAILKAKAEAAAKATAEKEAKLLAKQEEARQKAIAKQQAATEAALRKKAEKEATLQAAQRAKAEKDATIQAAKKEKDEAALKAIADKDATKSKEDETTMSDAPQEEDDSNDDIEPEQEKDDTKTDNKSTKTSADTTPDAVETNEQATLHHGGRVILTELDEIVTIVNDQQKITIAALARKIKLPVKNVEYWCAKLSEKEIIKLHYPVVGSAVVLSMMKKEEKETPVKTKTPSPKAHNQKTRAHTSNLVRVLITLVIVLLLAAALWYYYGGQR